MAPAHTMQLAGRADWCSPSLRMGRPGARRRAAVRGPSYTSGIAPGNATTGTITFPLTVAWGRLEKTEEGECHERKQILGQEPGLAFTAA